MAGRVVRNLRIALLWGAPLLFIGYLFVYPLTRILAESLTGEGFAQLVDRERFRNAAWFTLWQAVVSTVLTLIASLPLTWAVSRFNFRGKQLVRALVTIPFVLPSVVVGASFLDLLPPGTVFADATSSMAVTSLLGSTGFVRCRENPASASLCTSLSVP